MICVAILVEKFSQMLHHVRLHGETGERYMGGCFILCCADAQPSRVYQHTIPSLFHSCKERPPVGFNVDSDGYDLCPSVCIRQTQLIVKDTNNNEVEKTDTVRDVPDLCGKKCAEVFLKSTPCDAMWKDGCDYICILLCIYARSICNKRMHVSRNCTGVYPKPRLLTRTTPTTYSCSVPAPKGFFAASTGYELCPSVCTHTLGYETQRGHHARCRKSDLLTETRWSAAGKSRWNNLGVQPTEAECGGACARNPRCMWAAWEHSNQHCHGENIPAPSQPSHQSAQNQSYHSTSCTNRIVRRRNPPPSQPIGFSDCVTVSVKQHTRMTFVHPRGFGHPGLFTFHTLVLVRFRRLEFLFVPEWGSCVCMTLVMVWIYSCRHASG